MTVHLDTETVEELRLVGAVDIVGDDEDKDAVMREDILGNNKRRIIVRDEAERSRGTSRVCGGYVHIGPVDVMGEIIAVGVARVEELICVSNWEDDINGILLEKDDFEMEREGREESRGESDLEMSTLPNIGFILGGEDEIGVAHSRYLEGILPFEEEEVAVPVQGFDPLIFLGDH